MPATPEVLFLRPIGEETKREIAWQCLMVEYGIHFSFDDSYALLDALPNDLSGVGLILIDPASWDEYHRRYAPRFEAFEAAGGIVFALRGPLDFQVIDENALRGDLEMVAASAPLTLHHPALRARLQARTFRQLYEQLREPYFMGQFNSGATRDPWNEPYSYGILQTIELFDRCDPAFGWAERLRVMLKSADPYSLQLARKEGVR